MAKRITYIPNRVIDTNGISDGATIDVFQAGTNTQVLIYSDDTLATPLANPLTVAAGAAVPKIYHDHTGNVRVRVTQSNGTVVSDDDPWNLLNADGVITTSGGSVQDFIDGAVTSEELDAAVAAAENSADIAEAARDAALLTGKIFPTTASALGRGVQGSGAITGGSGGTNGTFPLVTSGGTQVIPVRGTFTVSGGAVTAISVQYPGYYTSDPTGFNFAASAGLTGASATPTMGANTGVGEYFLVFDGESGVAFDVYEVTAGPAATLRDQLPNAEYVASIAAEALDRVYTFQRDGAVVSPVFDWTLAEDTAFLNGALVSTSSFTDHGDGSFSLPFIPSGLSAGVTVYAEVELSGDPATAGGYIFSQASLAPGIQGEVSAIWDYSTLGIPSPGFQMQRRNATTMVDQSSRFCWGATSAVIAVPSSGSARYLIEGRDVETVSSSGITYEAPTLFSIGRRIDGTGVISGISIKRIVVFAGALSEAEMIAMRNTLDPQIEAPSAATVREPFPKWLPVVETDAGEKIVPAYFRDPVRGRYWYKGKVRDASEVEETDANGNKRLIKPPKLTDGAGVTVFNDVQPLKFYDTGSAPSGTLYQGLQSYVAGLTSGRLQASLDVSNNNPAVPASFIAPGGLLNPTGFSSVLANSYGARVANVPATAPALVANRGQGIIRMGVSIPGTSGNPVLRSYDAWPVETHTNTSSNYAIQDYWTFGGLRDGTAELANAVNEQTVIYDRALTASEMQRVALFNEYGLPALLTITDSFGNNQMILDAIRLIYADAGCTYIPIMHIGLGSRGLSFHLEHLRLYTALHDYMRDMIPVVVEGGLDFSSLAIDGVTRVPASGDYSRRAMIGYCRDIFEEFRSNRAVYCEPSRNHLVGDATALAKNQQFIDDFVASYPQFWAATNARMKAQAASDADYITQMASTALPPALMQGPTDVHPNWGTAWTAAASGTYHYGKAIVETLASQGYNPIRSEAV